MPPTSGCKTEFDSDGVLKLEGEELKDARDIMSLPSRTSQALVFPPRAVVRMGFILKDSAVAAQLRTVTLNVLQGVGQAVDRKILDALAAGFPALSPFRVGADLKISAPLAPHFDMIERKLRGSFPDGAIPGLKKNAK